MYIWKENNKKIGWYGKKSGSIQKAFSETQISKKGTKGKETVYKEVSRSRNP
jgi:hypothetical protein